MRIKSNVQFIFYIFLLIFFCTSCQPTKDDHPQTSIVEPPSRSTPLAPIFWSETELLYNTQQAFISGNRDFWEEVSSTAYPVLHPSFETRDIFIDSMIEYSELYDFRCMNVLSHPAINFSDWDGAEEITLVFAGNPIAGDEVFQNSSTPNAISIYEVTYLTSGENPLAYYLYRYGFVWSEGETIQENYETFFYMRNETVSKYGLEISIEPCP